MQFTVTPQFDLKDPRETITITLSAAAMLAPGETLTSVIATSITTTTGVDATPSLVLSGIIINGAPINLLNGVTLASGVAVQAVVTAGNFGSTYWIAITCATSNPNKTLVLKALLPMSQM